MSQDITRRGALAFAGSLAALAMGACAPGQGTKPSAGAKPTVEPLDPATTASWDAAYYTPAFSSLPDATTASDDVARRIEADGIVLLKNDQGVLPLASGTAVSLLGRGAVDTVLFGKGAAETDQTTHISLVQALGERFTLNSATTDFIAGAYADYPRGHVEVLDDPSTTSYYIGEIPWDAYPESVRNSVAGTLPIIVLTRQSGEGGDLSTDLLRDLNSGESTTFVPNAETANYVEGQHELELTAEERGLIAGAKAAAGKVVVLLNLATTMEVGPLTQKDGELEAAAMLHIGYPGRVGCAAVADILDGTLSPSGHTCDCWATDLTATPSFKNFGRHTYTDVTDYYTKIGSGAHFVEYEEGIYVGYRWFETAAATGAIDYDKAVSFPFGFGLSYTTFTSKLDECAQDGDDMVAKVSVTNTGQREGKHVVQMYYSAPWKEGQPERSAVVLAAFAKTEPLGAGESATVELRWALDDMASYDMDEKCWIMPSGSYEMSLRDDAHTIVDTKTVELSERVRKTDVGGDVTNRFDNVTAYMRDHCTQLTRGDMEGTYPQMAEDKTAESVGLKLEEYDPFDHVDQADEMPVSDADNGVSLIDLRGRDLDDPLWDLLLDQMRTAQVAKALSEHTRGDLAIATHGVPAMKTMGKPQTTDTDGPSGIIQYNGTDTPCCSYPSEYTVAQTWNEGLALQQGEMLGQEALQIQLFGWYAPALNCHRSPFGGRNFEYYSEDPLLAGTMGAAVVEGAAKSGLSCHIKHFCVNDQDTDRSAHLLTWVNEQAIREIYARPFELCVKRPHTEMTYLDETGAKQTKTMPALLAVMSSYNYLGDVWAGGLEALQTGLLRDEWGFEGYVVSDYSSYDYMEKNQALYAGTDLNLSSAAITGDIKDTESATAVKSMRRAMHRYLFCVANSAMMNGQVPTVKVTQGGLG